MFYNRPVGSPAFDTCKLPTHWESLCSQVLQNHPLQGHKCKWRLCSLGHSAARCCNKKKQQPGATNTRYTQAQAKRNARAKSSEPQSGTSRIVLPLRFFVSWAAWKWFKTVSLSQADAPGSQTTPRICPPSTVKQCSTKSKFWHKSKSIYQKKA